MRKIALFCEDHGHETVIKAIVNRLAPEETTHVATLSARHGKGRALAELGNYFRDIEKGFIAAPDAIVAAIDANCKGYNEKRKEIDARTPEAVRCIPLVHAIPDPHVERWLLLDSRAFKQVFGQGCVAPDQKCEKGRYKDLLRTAIRSAGGAPLFGGFERAEEIVERMDLENAGKRDESLKRFLEDMQRVLKRWEK